MARTPTGTIFSVAAAFGPAKTTSVVTNAVQAIVTAAGHGFANGDVVEISSAWGRLHKRYFEIDTVTTDTFRALKANTSLTDIYDPGAGLGSVRKVTTFTQLQKTMNPNTTGGDPKNINYQFTEADTEFMLNDGFSATGFNLELDDDDTTAGYAALEALTDVQSDTVLKQRLKNGSRIYLPCTVALNPMTIMQTGQINRLKVAFAGNNRPTRYSV